jgi:hypothetical protein
VLQRELRHRFPSLTVLVSPLDGDLQVAYLLPRDRYGLGLYQEEPSSLAPGCLEVLIEAIATRIAAICGQEGTLIPVHTFGAGEGGEASSAG